MYLPEVPVYPGRMSWRYRSNVRTILPLEEVAHERPHHGEILSTLEAEVIFTASTTLPDGSEMGRLHVCIRHWRYTT